MAKVTPAISVCAVMEKLGFDPNMHNIKVQIFFSDKAMQNRGGDRRR
jgi:hypothetical protein